MTRLLPLACLALLGNISAQAQEAMASAAGSAAGPRPEPAAAAAPVTAVTITGTAISDTQARQDSTAAKTVIGRAEIDRHGATSMGEILKRLPGITINSAPGRSGGEIRMRGLGNGYTQVLVNGERPQAGFSPESLVPEQVERIEIIRGAVAEYSAQGIAGTINIVLREGYRQKDVQLRLTDTLDDGKHSPIVSISLPGKNGALTWLLTATATSNIEKDDSTTSYVDMLADATVVRAETATDHIKPRNNMLQVAPRITYRFANGDTLNFQPALSASHSHNSIRGTLAQRIGSVAPEYARVFGNGDADAVFFRGTGNWLHKMAQGGKLDVKFSLGAGRTESTAARDQYDAAGVLLDRYDDRDKARGWGITNGAKYTRPLAKGHVIAAGWDAEAGYSRRRTDALRNGAPIFADAGGEVSADTLRLGLYVQDEWEITPQWSAYLGLRWEGLRIKAEKQARAISNRASVLSPILHTVWRIPGTTKDQVRASLSRAYRAPQLTELLATPLASRLNGPTRPDRMGNPDLKPELAQGLDLAYEHYLGKSGIISAGGFVRRIDDLIRRELSLVQTAQGLRWVSRPANAGDARSSGIELEAKLMASELWQDAPKVDLRANYSYFWSSVDQVPGPDNRLDQQVRQTGNLGIDYHLNKLPLSIGGTYNWTPAGAVQLSSVERVVTGAKRQLDIYALWKFDANTNLRIGGRNLLAQDYLTDRVVATGLLTQGAATATSTRATWTIKLETKL